MSVRKEVRTKRAFLLLAKQPLVSRINNRAVLCALKRPLTLLVGGSILLAEAKIFAPPLLIGERTIVQILGFLLFKMHFFYWQR